MRVLAIPTFLDVEDRRRLSSKKSPNGSLSAFRPLDRITESKPEITRAKTLHQGHFTRLIKITQATSRYPERDVLVLMLGHCCGIRITEISRLTVSDVMHASGKLRSEISMCEAITKGCRQRCAYQASKPAIQALESYPKYRIERGVGIEIDIGRGCVKTRVAPAVGRPAQNPTAQKVRPTTHDLVASKA